MMHEESQMSTWRLLNGNGNTCNSMASENRPYRADRDPHNPVLQIAGVPGDCIVLGKLCHALG